MRLIPQLKILSATLERKYRNLNSGGCGVVAYHVGKWLERLGIPVEVLIMGTEDKTEVVKEYFAENEEFDFSDFKRSTWLYFAHVILEFRYRGRTYYYDSTGIGPDISVVAYADHYKVPTRGFTLEHLGKSLEDRYSYHWNSSFSRRQIPKIKSDVEGHLSTLQNSEVA